MGQYTNTTNLMEGMRIGSQTPADDRLVFVDIADLGTLGAGSQNAYRYYDGLRVWVMSTQKEYIWREKVGSEVGAIADFTYPANIVNGGITYSGKTYNFYETGYVGVTSLGSVYNGAASLVATVTSTIVVPDCQRIVDVTIYNNSTGEDITSGVQIERTNPDTVDLTINVSLDVDYEIIYITA